MSAEARSEVSAKGHTNGLGSMSAKVRSTEGEKLGTKWEQQYAEFEKHVGMPKKGSELCNWKSTQLNNGPYGLDARIDQEIA